MHNLRFVVDSINYGGGRVTKYTGLSIEKIISHGQYIYVLYNKRANNLDPNRNIVCFSEDGDMHWIVEAAPAQEKFSPGWKSMEIMNGFIDATNSVNKHYRIHCDTGRLIN